MKTRIIRLLVLVLLPCHLLTACYTYRSIAKSDDSVSADLASELTLNTLYLVKLKSGTKTKMKVTGVDANNLYGTSYTQDQKGKQLENPNSTIPLHQVESIKEKKINILLSAGAIVVPLAILIYAGLQSVKNISPW